MKEKMKKYTTIEQSKELIRFGVDPKTADMWSAPDGYPVVFKEGRLPFEGEIPTWSIGALFELLPAVVEHKKLLLHPRLLLSKATAGRYYLEIGDYSQYGHVYVDYAQGDDLVDVLVKVIKRLKAKG